MLLQIIGKFTMDKSSIFFLHKISFLTGSDYQFIGEVKV